MKRSCGGGLDFEALKTDRHVPLEEVPDRNDADWFFFQREFFSGLLAFASSVIAPLHEDIQYIIIIQDRTHSIETGRPISQRP